MELWKNLNCMDNINPYLYEISNMGNIRRVSDKKEVHKIYANNGYIYVSLLDLNNSTHLHLLHRLVLMTFTLFKKVNVNQVNHKDSNKLNNNIQNLEWVTPLENTKHSMNHGNFKFCEDLYNAIFTNNQVHEICRMLEQDFSYNEILSKLNIDINKNRIDYIGNIKRGITYKKISSNYNIENHKCTYSKFNKDQLNFIYECIKQGMNYKDIANIMNIDIRTRKQQKSFSDLVLRIRKGESFKNIINYEKEGSTTIENVI